MEFLESHTLSGLNLLVTGATTIFTTDAGKTFIPVLITMRVQTLTGLSDHTQTINIGTNSSSYDNILAGNLSFDNAVDKTSSLVPNQIPTLVVAGGTAIKINVVSAPTATTYTGSVTITGFYVCS